MSQRAALAMLDLTTPRTGIITSYDPKKHAVKVAIQPEGVEVAGWIPLGAAGVGNGFGIVCGPNLGDMVQIAFDNGSPNAPRIVGRFFSNVNMPPAVPSGDTYIVHQSGSALKFNGDGTITVAATSSITYTATQHHFVGPVQMDNTLNVNQNVTSKADIQDNTATNSHTMSQMRSIYNSHTHQILNVQGGSSTVTSNAPTQQE
jgi:uncharacterized protein involved in type VI secretion and phage assembly